MEQQLTIWTSSLMLSLRAAKYDLAESLVKRHLGKKYKKQPLYMIDGIYLNGMIQFKYFI